MFSWLHGKTTASYDPVPDNQTPIVSNSRPQTASSSSHQKQYSHGRQFYSIFYDLDQYVYEYMLIDQLYFV